MNSNGLFLILLAIGDVSSSSSSKSEKNQVNNLPIVVNTWSFLNATKAAFNSLIQNNDALLAVENGCTECEVLRCDGTVGYGGSPDESGDVALGFSSLFTFFYYVWKYFKI